MTIGLTYSGMMKGLPSSQYHSITSHFGSTQIKTVKRSLAHFKAMIDGNIEFSKSQKNAFDLGRCAHSIILEQDLSSIIQGPNISNKTVKKWKEFVKAYPEKIVLTSTEFLRVTSMFDAFCSHKYAHEFVSQSEIENSYFYQDIDTGLYLKARPDGCNTERGFIFDFKTTGMSATPRNVARTAVDHGWHISAAHYIAGVEAVTGKKIKDYYFILQEVHPPFELMIYRLNDTDLLRAQNERRILLNQISVAMRTNHFPGYESTIQNLEIPDYAFDSENIFEEVV